MCIDKFLLELISRILVCVIYEYNKEMYNKFSSYNYIQNLAKCEHVEFINMYFLNWLLHFILVESFSQSKPT